MDYREKVKSTEDLARIVAAEKARGRRIVHCHGCFDILHPGHIRHLAWARQQGDVLVVTVSADAAVQKGLDRPFVPGELRAENLAAIGFVDYVGIDEHEWAGPILELLKPHVYVKGKEFEHVYTGRIGRERDLVLKFGGTVLFSSGDVVYSSTSIYESERVRLGLPDERLRRFRMRNGISHEAVEELLRRPRREPILVTGDVVIVEDVPCTPVGRSGDGIVPAGRVTERRPWIDGAVVVARALTRLGAPVRLVGLVGGDAAGAWARDALEAEPFPVTLVSDPTRPTARRERFVAGDREVFVAHEFKDHPLEAQLESDLAGAVRAASSGMAAVVAVDHGAGALGTRVLEELRLGAGLEEVPLIGFTDPLNGYPSILALEGLTVAVTSESALRTTFCDATSGVADIAALALFRSGSRHLVVCLPDGGLLLLVRGGHGRGAELSLHELRTTTPTDYLPSFGPGGSAPVAPAALLGPLAYCLGRGTSFMLAAYAACAGAPVLSRSRAAGQALREQLLRFLVEYSYLPDERVSLAVPAGAAPGRRAR